MHWYMKDQDGLWAKFDKQGLSSISVYWYGICHQTYTIDTKKF